MVFTTDGLILMGRMNCRGAKRLRTAVTWDAPDCWCYHATSGQLSNAGGSEVCRAAGIQAALRLIDTWLILPVEYAYLKD